LTLVQILAEFAASPDAPNEVRASVVDRDPNPDDDNGHGTFVAGVIGERTNNAAGAVTRLLDMGVDDYLMCSTVNGVLAHSLDYDDTHLPSILHPSASIVPASLAAAELAGATGAQTIAAIAAGLEICVRLGMAGYDETTRNSMFFERGQHATSICGAIAGAASAAKLLGLDADGIAHAAASGVAQTPRASASAGAAAPMMSWKVVTCVALKTGSGR